MRRLLVLGIAGVVWAAVPACGSDPGDAGDAGADATADVTPKKDAASDSPFADDIAVFDSFPPADPTVDGGGPFLCNGCVCNGADHYCFLVSGGGAPPPMPLDFDAGDAGLCPEPDAGPASCRPVPANCLPDPSCSCITQSQGGSGCQVDPSGNGIVVTLLAP